MRHHRIWLFAVIVISAAFHPVLAVAGVYFTGVGDLPNGTYSSEAFAVSANGSVVVGRSRDASGTAPFRWTASGGIESLGHTAGGNNLDVAYGVSADGAAIVGYGGGSAFQWSAGTGLVPISGATFANGVSADGSIIVGNIALGGGGSNSYQWSAGGGLIVLGSGEARGVSADGTVIAGTHQFGLELRTSIWTASGGFQSIGKGTANAISGDGSTVVGVAPSNGPAPNAFLWTQAGGVVILPNSPFFSEAYAVSYDGSVIVGRSAPAFAGNDNVNFSAQTAFIYDAIAGYRDLKTLLTSDYNLNLAGWTLTTATGISADGRTIVGIGINPDGFTEGWVASLGAAPVPEPSSWIIFTVAALLVSGRRIAALKLAY